MNNYSVLLVWCLAVFYTKYAQGSKSPNNTHPYLVSRSPGLFDDLLVFTKKYLSPHNELNSTTKNGSETSLHTSTDLNPSNKHKNENLPNTHNDQAVKPTRHTRPSQCLEYSESESLQELEVIEKMCKKPTDYKAEFSNQQSEGIKGHKPISSAKSSGENEVNKIASNLPQTLLCQDSSTVHKISDYNNKETIPFVPSIIIRNSSAYNELKASIQRTTMLTWVLHCNSERLKDWSCNNGCNPHNKLEKYKLIENWYQVAKAIVGVDHKLKEIIVSFKSSDILNYFKQNIHVDKTPFIDIGEIHLGFYEYYKSFKNIHIKILIKMLYRYPDYDVVFSGVSLGGACAVIAGAYFKAKFHYKKKIKIYTVGQPDMGDKKFADWVDNNLEVLRIYNYRDPIVHVGIGAGFVHTKNYMVIRDEAIVHCLGKNDDYFMQDTCEKHPVGFINNFYHLKILGLYYDKTCPDDKMALEGLAFATCRAASALNIISSLFNIGS